MATKPVDPVLRPPHNERMAAVKLLPLTFALLVVASAVSLAACGGGGDEGPVYLGPLDTIAFGGREGEEYGLYLMRPDGSELRRVTTESGFLFFPSWSPLGDRIAYIAGNERDEQPGKLVIYDVIAGSTTTVSENALPSLTGPAVSWSPDGERLVFAEATEGGHIRVFDVEDGALADFPGVAGSTPAWSPDGDQIAFIDANGDVALAGADGSDASAPVERAQLEGNPRWSPDGDRLALWSAPAEPPRQPSVIVVDADDGEAVELGEGDAAVWSPDGRRIAYAGPGLDSPAALDVFLAPAGGGTPQRLTQAITADGFPSWSPSGDLLMYLAQADLQTAFLCVYSLTLPGSDCPELPEGLEPEAPAWSPE